MRIATHNHTVFKDEKTALFAVSDLKHTEYRIKFDPKGTGKCIIELLDEEDGSFVCNM